MDQSPTARNPQLALHAYKLGYAPVMLELDARSRWEMAVLAEELLLDRDGTDEGAGWPEEDSPFPVELSRYLREIHDAGDALVDHLHRGSRDELFKALAEGSERAWRVYQESWLGWMHRAKICEREAAEGGVDMWKASPFVDPAWRDFRLAVQQFGASLPEPLGDWAALGADLAAVPGIMPPTFRQDPLPDQASPAPYDSARAFLQKLKARDPGLEGLDLPAAEGWTERLERARRLHEQILSRLGASGDAAVGGQERWKRASEALALATGMGVNRTISWLTKAARRQPPPFKSRPRGQRGLDVDMLSFFDFLETELMRESAEAANPGKGKPKVRPKSALQTRVEEQQSREAKAREKLERDALQARKKPKG